jgi:hypothetical protein
MLDRTEACFDLKPKRLAADTAYGTGKFLGWLVKEKRIAPHIPVWERPKREDGKFSSSDFRWDGRRGLYICPNGKQLRTSGTVHSDGRQRYRARKSDCDACPLRAQCGSKNEPHHIARDVHEDARDVARRQMKTKAFLKSRDQRKRVEMRTPEDPPWLRAVAPARPLGCPRRVPPCGHRAEPQDARPAPHQAATRARLRVSCVASIWCSIEADARMGKATKSGSALRLPQKANSQPQPLSPPTFSTASVKTSHLDSERDASAIRAQAEVGRTLSVSTGTLHYISVPNSTASSIPV